MATEALNTTWPSRMVRLPQRGEGVEVVACLHEEDERGYRDDDLGNDEGQVHEGVERRAEPRLHPGQGQRRAQSQQRWR